MKVRWRLQYPPGLIPRSLPRESSILFFKFRNLYQFSTHVQQWLVGFIAASKNRLRSIEKKVENVLYDWWVETADKCYSSTSKGAWPDRKFWVLYFRGIWPNRKSQAISYSGFRGCQWSRFVDSVLNYLSFWEVEDNQGCQLQLYLAHKA